MSVNKVNEITILPVIVTFTPLILPLMIRELYIKRKESLASFNTSESDYKGYCLIVFQYYKDEKSVNIENLSKFGCLSYINKVSKVGEDEYKIEVEGLYRAKITKYYFENNVLFAKYSKCEDRRNKSLEKIYLSSIIENTKILINNNIFNQNINEFLQKLKEGAECNLLINLIVTSLNDIDPKFVDTFLSYNDVSKREATLLYDCLVYKFLQCKKNGIDFNNYSKHFYDNDEPFEEDNEDSFIIKIKKIISEKKLPSLVIDKINEEIERYQRIPAGTLESSLIVDYVSLLISLPYGEKSEDQKDLKEAIKILNEDHYGLKKPKERIIEYLAIKSITNSLKAPILCFYGPPGCGKTSLAKSIARSLNRKFIKCSLGGISDEAEIRGHRRTYVGSKPGRIIQNIRRVGVSNPVFLLDEIDKIGKNALRGDVSSALLEVLDPEQNKEFIDSYLEVPFDLSDVLFICTANDLESIPTALIDRLELIELESYTLLEKIRIAKLYLIKKELKINGFSNRNIVFSDKAIAYIVEHYTEESGVRELEREIATILRKIAVEELTKNVKYEKEINVEDVKKFLGVEIYNFNKKNDELQIGVVNGLAYTPFGGDVLPIEINYFKGEGNLVLTGQLGDVMKESSELAFDYIRGHAKEFNIDEDIFNKIDVHLHAPSGSIKKDGPSGGCAITVAMYSAFKKLKIDQSIALTGEITLTGNVLPIGGLKEKTLGAIRNGIKTIILPLENKKDIEELDDYIKKSIKFVYIKNVKEALNYIFKD